MAKIKRYNATLRNLEYRLRAFKDYFPELLENAVMEKEDVIVKAIQNQLYQRGINGKGVKIWDYAPYRPYTIEYKKFMGQPHTRVTLKDTGEFYAGMYVVFDSDGFYVTSSDPKTEKLVNKYGAEIFRLTNSNLTRIVRVHLRRNIIKEIKQIIRSVKK